MWGTSSSSQGGHGSHNGLKNVICNFRGNTMFPRLRMGIGRPPGQMDPKAFLLQRFNVASRERIDAALKKRVCALEQVVQRADRKCKMFQY